jgi:deoxyribodipyrimidine photo-lyase
VTSTLVWFRRDLRLADHPALAWAGADSRRPVPVYVDAPDAEVPWPSGGATRWWLHRSLAVLDLELRTAGLALTHLAGDPVAELARAAQEAGADTVAWNRALEPGLAARDEAVAAGLRDRGLAVALFDSGLLHAPRRLQKDDGGAYRVFTPFARRLRRDLRPVDPAPPPEPRDGPGTALAIDLGLDRLGLLQDPPWHARLEHHWEPGEAGAWRRLEVFLDESITDYDRRRDLPGTGGTSRLSPHLHFGEITPVQVLARLAPHLAGDRGATVGAERFLGELLWREFAHYVLHHRPESPTTSLDARYDRSGFWIDDPEGLRRWQRGETGIALVDAGMRELWATGWMHNRVRMVAASFLVKQLGVDWRHGAAWFHDTLVDADLANNTLGWQWVAGCGVDAAPYFRVFNPDLQAKKFDADATYRNRWLPDAYRRHPPTPLVDLRQARAAALDRYQLQIKQGA